MAKSKRKLDELAVLLERTGGDPTRLEAVRRAQSFRRSWLELAESLVKIRRERRFQSWGYEDFHSYCSQELTLKRVTVDKLMVSFSTIERHAPDVLSRDGIARAIPSIEAVSYLARIARDPVEEDEFDDATTGEGQQTDLETGGATMAAERSRAARRAKVAKLPPPRVSGPELGELQHAVFQEGQPVAELRKRFDSVFFPKLPAAEELAVIARASGLARKLAMLLPDIGALSEVRAQKLEAELGKFRAELETLEQGTKERLARQETRARKQSA